MSALQTSKVGGLLTKVNLSPFSKELGFLMRVEFLTLILAYAGTCI